MKRAAPAPAGPLPDDVLSRIERLYADSLFLQARALGERYFPLHRWRGARGLLMASRLSAQLGDPRRACALATLAARQFPASVAARAAHARALGRHAGAEAAWQYIRRHGRVEPATARERAEWLALEAVMLAALRDFPFATDRIERALDVAGDDAWIWVERSSVLEFEDRHEESLAAARRALALAPRYAAAVHATVDALFRLGRGGEALGILREIVPAVESFLLTRLLVGSLLECEAHAEAEAHAARLAELAPLLSPAGVGHLHGLRSDIAYHLGDDTTALAEARRAGPGFHATVAATLAAWSGPPRRVRLAVPFVRQHFRTCGPATLTALARFWGFEVEHETLAKQIAYEGTFDHEERHWAETSLGCVVREFTVTWEAALDLLDRGLPFSLTTIGPTAGHLQAVIGYDARRGTLLVQDPYAGLAECTQGLLVEQAASGPRGMVLVPKPEAGRLDGALLPDAERRDALHRVKRALAAHDRGGATREADALAAAGDDDRFAVEARWVVARYDGDVVAGLRCAEALLDCYPDSEWLATQKYRYLVTLAHRPERLALVEAMTARPDWDPVWAQYAAEEYRHDARTWPSAVRWARRAIRRLPTEAGAYHVLALVHAQQRRFDEALALARFAACLNPTDDDLSEFYVAQAAIVGRVEEALELLRWRVRRYGPQSSGPARALFTCLCQAHRFAEALDVLGEALATHPDDPDLLLFAAQEYARDGDHQRAEALLDRARALARPALWARAAAEVAMARGDLPRAVALWRDVVSELPLDVIAHGNLASALGQLEGLEAALAHLRAVAERWPHHLGVQQQYVEWLRNADPDDRRGVLEALVSTHPTFVWAQRELAWQCLQQGRLSEAATAADHALVLDPHATSGHAIRGAVHAAAGERNQAAAALRDAIRLDVDNAFAIGELVANADTAERRREALGFVRAELERQTVFGAGLTAYRDAARAVLSAEEVLALCREALVARPDLLPAWTETIRQLLDVGDAAEALALVERAVAQFPVIAELYGLQAQAFLLAGDRERQLAALTRARELAPAHAVYAVLLGRALAEAGRLDDACRVLEETVRRAPADAAARLAQADALWMTGRRRDAIRAVEQVIERGLDEPGAWERLSRWGLETGEPERAAGLARRLTTERPRDARAWRALATVVEADARIEALGRAIELAPRDEQARDVLAIALAEAGRFAEAIALCQAEVLGPAPPVSLRGRAAWVEAARGRRGEAIRRMRQILDERPSYTWGWLQLATWCSEDGDHQAAVEAAGWLLRLLPGDSGAWAHLGRFQLAADRRDDGKASLRRALELDARHEWAGALLLDALIDDKELDAAAALAPRLAGADDSPWLLSSTIRLAAARGERSSARSAFERLCAQPAARLSALGPAADALVAAGWGEDVDTVLRQRLAGREAVSSDVIGLYGILEATRWHGGHDLDVFAAYVRSGPRGTQAALAFLVRAVEQRTFEAGHRLRRACQAVFERDDEVWGQYGHLLLEEGRTAEAATWMRDWARREGRRPWMLLNLAVALRALGDWSAAAAVHADAERLPPDHARGDHLCWLALDDALAGRVDSARARLQAADADNLAPFYRALRDLALACVEGTADPHRGDVLLAAAARSYKLRSDPGLRRAYRRCRALVARRHGGTWDRLRAWCLERLAGTNRAFSF